MRRLRPLALLLVCLVSTVSARHETGGCGTTRETEQEVLFLHRQSVRTRAVRVLAAFPPTASGSRDVGNIAIIEDSDGVVARQNQFNLDSNTLAFVPVAPNASQYRYSVAAQGYDAAAADNGMPLAALDDDDTRAFSLPFAFPFFGSVYNQIFVNSDGNLTFSLGDSSSTERSLGRMTAGAPRISPLFEDLDPSKTAGGVRWFADSSRVVVSWKQVPEYPATGIGVLQTFQARLYADGRIEFSYSGVNPTSAVVGIAPGGLQGTASLVDYRNDPSGSYAGAIAERFGNSVSVDIVTTAQKFYQTHEDSYDYLVIYNNEGIPALGEGTVAYENTVRATAVGYGRSAFDNGAQYGSAGRLQAILQLGQLSQYPANPNDLVAARAAQRDTPVTVLAHEAGHLFLAFASVGDPNNPIATPMLGYQNAHWSFLYDSEASLLEGERIVDRGPNASPEFVTIDITQAYSPLDQYLMGFRAAANVPDTFYVSNPSPNYAATLHQYSGFAFNGTRHNVALGDVIQAVGRRTPDYTVAQRRYRFAFLLIVPQGSAPSAADLVQVDGYRQQFESFYARASSNHAVADTSLKRSLRLSWFPAAGVVAGTATTASLTVATPPASAMTVQILAPNGYAQVPASITIPAGAASATFAVSGLKAGVEEVSAIPADPSYETAVARVQVADATLLKLVTVTGDEQVSASSAPLPDPIVVRLTDVNNLAYAGARIVASPSNGGSVTPPAAITDEQGRATFHWTPAVAALNQLQLALDDSPGVSITLSAGAAVPVATAVVNAASFAAGIAAGALETIGGVHLAAGRTATADYPWPTTLAGVQVLLNGAPMPLLYVSDAQINFYVPPGASLGSGSLTVVPPSGTQATVPVNVATLAPGIFPGAILLAGTATSALTTPVYAGDTIEIYCTGLGPTRAAGGLETTALTPTVFIGATPVQPIFSGLAPGFVGLYQVNVQVPSGLAPGAQPVLISVSLAHSNSVNILVQ